MPKDQIEETSENLTEIVEKKKDNWSLREFFSFIFITAIIVIPIRLFVAQPFVVSGESMIPTFQDGEYLIVDELSYRIHNPERGDIVIFRFPQDESKFFIKRIIGLPGETLDLKNDKITVTKTDGEEITLNEPYIEYDKNNFISITLKDDEFFVMGDNRLKSLDSRIIGPIKKEYLVGRAFLRLLPVSSLGYLPGKANY